MLTREIPQHKHMDQIHVRALKNFLKVLIMVRLTTLYLPLIAAQSVRLDFSIFHIKLKKRAF